jgi:deoxyribose-phosphate aldolase
LFSLVFTVNQKINIKIYCEVVFLITRAQLVKVIDHTLLAPSATVDDIERLCREAIDYGFYAVCVNTCYIKHAVSMLKGSSVKVVSTVGFPLGAVSSDVKAYEAAWAVEAGASEVDMVLNVGLLKSGDFFEVREDIEGVVKAAKKANTKAKIKVIVETSLLEINEKVSVCRLVKDAGADLIKTSTGFGPGGAVVEDIQLFKKMVGDSIGIKAAGGIKDLNTLMSMLEAGATRIGTSSTVSIMNQLEQNNND